MSKAPPSRLGNGQNKRPGLSLNPGVFMNLISSLLTYRPIYLLIC